MIYLFVVLLGLVTFKLMDNVYAKIVFYCALTGFALFVSRYVLNAMTERLSWYFFYFIVLALPNSLEKFVKKDRRLITVLFGVFAIALFAYRVNGGALKYFHFCF